MYSHKCNFDSLVYKHTGKKKYRLYAQSRTSEGLVLLSVSENHIPKY